MITSFDDYMIHQTAEAVIIPSQSDRNFYERHWMTGFENTGDIFFEIGFGLYPNRHVMDGHFSVVIGSKQYAFHVSRRAPDDRIDTTVGPLSVTIEEPMRSLRFKVEDNEHNISCDLRFTAISIAHQEPHNTRYEGVHLIMYNTRFTQAGHWNGTITVDSETHQIENATAIRDKSWGVRPVGEPVGGAPGLMNGEPGVYWNWSPVMFGDQWLHFATFQDPDGNPTQESCELVPLYSDQSNIPEGDDAGIIPMPNMSHRLTWNKGTRLSSGSTVNCSDKDGNSYEAKLTPFGKPFYMLGIGYNHPKWGHAVWQGELAMDREDFDLDAIDPLAYEHIHTHQRVTATMEKTAANGVKESKSGFGVLETIVIGRHDPSGFKEFFDGAK